MQPNAADAVKRVLTMAGVTGAAFTLSAAASLPAFAAHNGGGDGNGSQTTSASQSTDDQSKDSQTQDTKTRNAQGNAQQDGHNPPGNNGTVKIHQVAGDSSPHNIPHVTCDFYVSFFGFDNNQTLHVSFTGQAPTGKDTPIAITGPGLSSKTSTTDAGGAGNDYDGDLGAYNGSNLDLSGLGAPAKQGYHIKLDVSTGEPGGHKYKVFWFTPCGTTGSPTPTTGGTTPTAAGTETENGSGSTTSTTGGTTPTVAGAGTAGSTTGGATVLGESITRRITPATTTSGSPPASVLGESVTRGTTAGLSSLPFTGAETGVLAALGLAALGGGTALTVAGRRRRAAARA